MADLNANRYSSTQQLIGDAIALSQSERRTVTIDVPSHRRPGIADELFESCEGHNDAGVYWGVVDVDGRERKWKVEIVDV